MSRSRRKKKPAKSPCGCFLCTGLTKERHRKPTRREIKAAEAFAEALIIWCA